MAIADGKSLCATGGHSHGYKDNGDLRPHDATCPELRLACSARRRPLVYKNRGASRWDFAPSCDPDNGRATCPWNGAGRHHTVFVLLAQRALDEASDVSPSLCSPETSDSASEVKIAVETRGLSSGPLSSRLGESYTAHSR